MANENGGLSMTATGRGVTVGAVGVGLLGWSLGYVVLVVVGVAGIGLVVATALAVRSVPTLAVERIVEPGRITRGRRAHGFVSVRNPTDRTTSRCSATERIEVDGPGSTRDDRDIAIASLRAGQVVAVTYDLPTERRGVVRIGPLTLERRDAFGIWDASRELGGTTELFVDPCVVPIEPRPTGRHRHLEGPTSERAPRGTQTFQSLREYVRGDDRRHVHWRSTAKTGTLMVREHVDTSRPSTVVVLDTRPEPYAGPDGAAFEEAVDVAASVVVASTRHGFPTRLVTTDGVAVAVRGSHHAHALSTRLSTVRTGEGSCGLDGIASLVRAGRDRDAIVVITGSVERIDLVHASAITANFDRPSLVTIRPAGGDSWSSGVHLDAPTAREALQRWAR